MTKFLLSISRIIFFLVIMTVVTSSAQMKIEISENTKKHRDEHSYRISNEAYVKFDSQSKTKKYVPSLKFKSAQFPKVLNQHVEVIADEQSNILAIKGKLPNELKGLSHSEKISSYIAEVWGIALDTEKLKLNPVKKIIDSNGRAHYRIRQFYEDVEIYEGELLAHVDVDDQVYMLQGHLYDINWPLDVHPLISEQKAIKIAQSQYADFIAFNDKVKKLMRSDQIEIDLMIYTKSEEPILSYIVNIYSNLAEKERIIINANNGQIIERFDQLCKIHNHDNVIGQAVGSSTDLFGEQRSLNVYECSDGYFMVDASRPMFKGLETSCDNSDQLLNGVIITLDAGNTSPVNRNFDYQIGASSNLNNWNNPTAVSAHFNGGKAYEYFKNTFGRESITGNGSNIVSFINVADDDGSQMDNAFWNGEFIFYGNGNQAFNAPLAKALDVAGHEMSHGVIQTTANLVYQGEPGALNEHFADVFGVLIEREDFNIGEDITNPNIFPTGTLRSMSNPNNGGRRLGDPGYQPAHVNEQYFGSEDNGGVHINSGIPNLAFYRFVTDESFASSIDERAAIAEQIWYKALTQYLRSSSNFADMRIAIVQAAQEDYGAQVANAAANAFESVGITGQNVTAPVEELEENPGNEYVLWSDLGLNKINVSASASAEILGAISNTSHISRPSATDNGQFVIFVNADKQIQAVEIDWTTGNIVSEFLVSEERIYRNATISKDATKIAAVTGDLAAGEFDNKIVIFDLVEQNFMEFELFNPTFSEDVTSTAGVLYADVLEFDFTGENLIYDAFNQLSGVFDDDLSYWDIGIINVYDNDQQGFGDGSIFKLFTGLPKDVSIGNPTFSKNSPNIIAFDYREIDPTTDERSYSVLGLNRESGDVKVIFENNTFGYPSYSLQDDQMVFNVINNNERILAIADLQEDKISATDEVFIFAESADWGLFIGDGIRDLSTNTEEIIASNALSIFPNPVRDVLNLALEESHSKNVHCRVYDLKGNLFYDQSIDRLTQINTQKWPSGQYVLQITTDSKNYISKFVKL